MSQAPFHSNFAFQDVQAARSFLENGSVPSPVAQANLPDLRRLPGYAGPVEQQLGRGYAAQQQEIGSAPLPAFDITIPELLQQVRAPVQQQWAARMPVPQAENGWAGHPAYAPNYFARAQQQAPSAPFPAAQAAPSGPNNYSLGSYTPEEKAEIERRAASEKGKKKLGPRAQAKCRQKAPAAAPAPQGVVKSKRAGPKKAAPGQPTYLWCFREHQRLCGEKMKCEETCPLRVHWPEDWLAKTECITVTADDTGEKVHCQRLFSWKWTNADGFRGKGRGKGRRGKQTLP